MDARLPVLLGLAFGQRMLDGQAEWQDVPEVVRTSFLLLAKEMRRLHRLVLAQQQFCDGSRSATTANPTARADMEDTRVHEMQAELSRLSKWSRDAQRLADERHARTKRKLSKVWAELAAMAEVSADAQTQHVSVSQRLTANWTATETQLRLSKWSRDAQRLADERHARTKRKLSKVWAELAAMAEVSADAQTQHVSVSQRLTANWTATETQLQLMQARLDAFEKEQLQKKKTRTPQNNTTDEALQHLSESQATCSQEIRRLQCALAVHDHRIVSCADPLQKPSPARQSELMLDPGRGRLSDTLLTPKEDMSGPSTQLTEPEKPVLEELSSTTHASLRLRYAEARRKQQRGRSEPVADGG